MVKPQEGRKHGCWPSRLQRPTQGNHQPILHHHHQTLSLMPIPQVKRILVPQRENPIVNRLNKTKVEKKPDLKQEKDDRLRELRNKDQEAQQQRVRACALKLWWLGLMLTSCRERRRRVRRRSGRRRSIKRITHTMSSSLRTTWRLRATRTAMRTGRTTSCKPRRAITYHTHRR